MHFRKLGTLSVVTFVVTHALAVPVADNKASLERRTDGTGEDGYECECRCPYPSSTYVPPEPITSEPWPTISLPTISEAPFPFPTTKPESPESTPCPSEWPSETYTSEPYETYTSEPYETYTSEPYETYTSEPYETYTSEPYETYTSKPAETYTPWPITTPIVPYPTPYEIWGRDQ